MSNYEPRITPAAKPAKPLANTRTITSLAMLTALAYIVMIISKALPCPRFPAFCSWT